MTTNFNFDLTNLNSEDLYALQIRITAELRRRTRSEAESAQVAEQSASQSKTEDKPVKTDTESFGAVIRDGKIVHTAARFISKGQRYAIRMAVKAAGGNQIHEGTVYDSLKSNDKFVEIWEFKTVKAAKVFMSDQRAYFEARKKG